MDGGDGSAVAQQRERDPGDGKDAEVAAEADDDLDPEERGENGRLAARSAAVFPARAPAQFDELNAGNDEENTDEYQ